MNKKLVALGVASAFALPLAAEAQTANVTLYGRLNMDIEWFNVTTCRSPASQGNSGGFVGAVNSSGQQVPAVGNQIITNCPNAPSGSTDSFYNTATTNPTVTRISSNSSRFGMRGTESLGGGLNAIFQIESNVSGDTGNASS